VVVPRLTAGTGLESWNWEFHISSAAEGSDTNRDDTCSSGLEHATRYSITTPKLPLVAWGCHPSFVWYRLYRVRAYK